MKSFQQQRHRPNLIYMTTHRLVTPIKWLINHITVTSYWARWRQNCLLNRLFRRRLKETSKLRVTGLCAGTVMRKMFPFDGVIMGPLTLHNKWKHITVPWPIKATKYEGWHNNKEKYFDCLKGVFETVFDFLFCFVLLWRCFCWHELSFCLDNQQYFPWVEKVT